MGDWCSKGVIDSDMDTEANKEKQKLDIINYGDSPEISPSVFSLTHDDETDKPLHININDDKRQFKLFENQVAGSLPMFHSDGLLYKPLKTDLEMTFYKNIIEWLPSIQPFIPKYSGIEYININNDTSSLHHTQNDHHDNNLSDEHDDDHEHDADINHNESSQEEEGDDHILFDLNTIANNKWSQQMYKKNKHRISKMPFLILEDITKKYHKPCILDLKIGTRHFAPICKRRKMERKLRKAWCSTCKDFGVRIGGIQIYNAHQQKYDIMAKDIGMMLEKNQFCQRIQEYFGNAKEEILLQFIHKLDDLKDILKDENRFRWFSCSLLFVYEGGDGHDDDDDEEDQEQLVDHDEEHEKDVIDELDVHELAVHDLDDEHKINHDLNDEGEHNKRFDAGRLDLRLIDFTNFVIVENYLDRLSKSDDDEDEEEEDEDKDGENMERLQLNKDLDNLHEPDHGILFGLDALIKLLNELKKTGNIQSRNDSEWMEFRDNISYSKMALQPFGNKNIFNKHTTI